MKHFSHPHDLHVEVFPSKNEREKRICSGCQSPLSGTCYACSLCNFYLHDSCLDLPQEAYLNPNPNSASTLGTEIKNILKRKDAEIMSLRNQLAPVKAELASVKRELASVSAELAEMKANARHRREDYDFAKRMEREANSQRLRDRMEMERMKAFSDSIDRLGQM